MTNKNSQFIFKGFLDLLILNTLKKNPQINVYLIIKFLKNKFEFNGSPNIIYSIVSDFQSKKLLKSSWLNNTKVYELTELGCQELIDYQNDFEMFNTKLNDHVHIGLKRDLFLKS